MPELVAFKSGRDLGEETCIEDEETVTCVDCGEVASDQTAYDQGWQFAPPVCPSCLRWSMADAACCCGSLP